MRKPKKNCKFLYIFILFFPTVVFASDYVVCGNEKKFPAVFATIISLLYVLVKIIVPIIFVIKGLISFLKVVLSNNVDEDMDKAKKKFFVNIIVAFVIFFIVSIINFVINLVAGTGNSFSQCLNCLVNPSTCATVESPANTRCPGLEGDQSLYDENCNLIPNARNGRTDYSTGQDGISTYTDPIPTNPSGPSNNVTTSNPVENSDVKIEVVNGVTFVNGILIVNKTYSLPSNYAPSGANNKDVCVNCLTTETMSAFNEMNTVAISEGINLEIRSGYRSYSNQSILYNNYVSRDGKAKADTFSARPGHSEHQTGLAFDACASNLSRDKCVNSSFDNTEPARWLDKNCYKFGFIIRYPNGKTNYTGYKYESWHLRYVGKDLAEKLYNNGDWISLEEYFHLTSSYE